jgi:hypothetical protein
MQNNVVPHAGTITWPKAMANDTITVKTSTSTATYWRNFFNIFGALSVKKPAAVQWRSFGADACTVSRRTRPPRVDKDGDGQSQTAEAVCERSVTVF